MLRGLTTVNFWAADMAAAKKWYTELLGFGLYFERPPGVEPPQYAEWRLGYQHELGLIDRKYSPAGSATGPGGVVVYWHVDDVQQCSRSCCPWERRSTSRPQTAKRGSLPLR
jgi:predicted enzyme related to lactoylglutathione lyase